MNLQTAIVEDSKPDAERLKQLLKKAFENENISCSCFASGDEFLRAGWREGYQVVFLDICMEGTNGIETAQRLRAADPDLLIVFVTSSPEYVWDAFPVHPFDYLLKPYKEEKFEQLAGELRRVLCRQQPELEVRIARQIVRLPLTKIYYATAQNHYVRVVTDDGECRATANFAQVQEQLQTQPEFLVCNRGVIINMSKVLRFEGDCIEMLDGTHLPVRQKDKNSTRRLSPMVMMSPVRFGRHRVRACSTRIPGTGRRATMTPFPSAGSSVLFIMLPTASQKVSHF